MGIDKVKLIYHTVKYLRFKQIYYRVYYALRNRLANKNYDYELKNSVKPIQWSNLVDKPTSYLSGLKFEFLNIPHEFKDDVNWSLEDYGKLWTYNLNYFDFLNQPSINKEDALYLINDYISKTKELRDGHEPYPISLRSINWIKYLSKENIKISQIDGFLYNQYLRLMDNLEYHLLANHLLENGLSLLFGAYYFQNEVFYSKAKQIITEELQEQILLDGAHFELSPMYHQIILDRVLDCIHLVESNSWQHNEELLSIMRSKSKKMLDWLDVMTFDNGEIPMLNDSAFGIAPSTSKIKKYAESLNITPEPIRLSNSGYRMFKADNFELVADVGEVGPTYQPGHAHADTFSFVLHSNGKPLIVDPGISTYNIGKERDEERSTAYHNTVTINGQDSSKVWSGFRVANRAHVTIKNESENSILASHNGFKNLGITHSRNFDCKDSLVLITDKLNKDEKGEAHFHFHPDCKVQIDSNNMEVKLNGVLLKFKGALDIEKQTYFYAQGYNNRIESAKVVVTFLKELETKVKLEG